MYRLTWVTGGGSILDRGSGGICENVLGAWYLLLDRLLGLCCHVCGLGGELALDGGCICDSTTSRVGIISRAKSAMALL